MKALKIPSNPFMLPIAIPRWFRPFATAMLDLGNGGLRNGDRWVLAEVSRGADMCGTLSHDGQYR